MHPRTLASEDRGTIIPLILGYLVFGLAIVFVCVNAMSLHLTQRRIDALADAAALAGADGFTIEVVGGRPTALLTDAHVAEQASVVLGASPVASTLLRAASPDGISAEVTVGTTWSPVLLSRFVPDVVSLESTAHARTVLW